MSKIADELKERSWTIRKTVRARYNEKLISELLADNNTCFSLQDDATYFWGPLAYNDPHILWMIRLELPGEA